MPARGHERAAVKLCIQDVIALHLQRLANQCTHIVVVVDDEEVSVPPGSRSNALFAFSVLTVEALR